MIAAQRSDSQSNALTRSAIPAPRVSIVLTMYNFTFLQATIAKYWLVSWVSANTPQIPNMIEAWDGETADMWERKVKFHPKIAPKIPSKYWRIYIDIKKLTWKQRDIFPSLQRSPVFPGFNFNLFTDIHEWTVLQKSRFIQRRLLTIISIEMMRNCVSTDNTTQWSGVEGKEQSTKNWPLGDFKREVKPEGQTITRPYCLPVT